MRFVRPNSGSGSSRRAVHVLRHVRESLGAIDRGRSTGGEAQVSGGGIDEGRCHVAREVVPVLDAAGGLVAERGAAEKVVGDEQAVVVVNQANQAAEAAVRIV